MGGEPALVGRVPREPAAELVIDPPPRHLVERVADHVQRVGVPRPRVVANQDPQVHRVRKLRRGAEPAVDRLEHPPQRSRRVVEQGQVERAGRTGDLPRALQLPNHVGGGGGDLVAFLLPGPLDAEQDARKAGHPARVGGRIIRPAVERLQVGGQEDRHRPAAVPGHRLDGGHVEVIEVGSFLAVDLDVDEPLVHQLRDRVVLEAFALHDVAPVAGRVADRQKDRFGLGPRLRQRLGSPGKPVDGVVLVLEQVRAGFPAQTVGGTVGVSVGVGHRRVGSSSGIEALGAAKRTSLSCTIPPPPPTNRPGVRWPWRAGRVASRRPGRIQ